MATATGTGLIMVIDTEATDMERGVPIQIAYFIVDAQTGTVRKEVDTLVVVPDGAVVNPAATRLHGITPERAQREGRALRDVLCEFTADARTCDAIVAHNAQADRELLVRACAASGVRMGDTPWDCTQLRTTAPCRLSAPAAGGLKPPRLHEAHSLLVGRGRGRDKDTGGEAGTEAGASGARRHDARADAQMCLQIWFALRRR